MPSGSDDLYFFGGIDDRRQVHPADPMRNPEYGSVDAVSSQAAAAAVLARRQARLALIPYIATMGDAYGVVPAAHHRLILQHLERVESGDCHRLMILMPPGSAKSTYVSVIFPAWYLGRGPARRVLAASHTDALAEKWSRRVRNTMPLPEYRAIFPACELATDSQAVSSWSTTARGEYRAAGVGSTIPGYRADLGLLDDPVAGREAADSELQRGRLWEWYWSDFMPRLTPGAAVVLIMQRWHEDDLAGRLIAAEEAGGEKWERLILPMEAEEDDPLGRSVGARLWPEYYTDEMVSAAKSDPRVWMALYQQRPRAMGGGEFRREWLRYYATTPRCGVKYILIDPASGKRKNNDYTSIWVVGLGTDGNYYALDLVRDRLNLAERAAEVMRLHRLHRPLEVRYEQYGMQADIEHLQSIMEKESYRFTVKDVGGGLKKEDRIRRLIPLFEAGRFWLPQSKSRTLHDGKTVDLVDIFREQEYLAFPVGRHDDMMDALARIADPEHPLKWPGQEDRPRIPPARPQSHGRGTGI